MQQQFTFHNSRMSSISSFVDFKQFRADRNPALCNAISWQYSTGQNHVT